MVDFAITADEGIEIAEANHPDLVILDILLPGKKDGWDALSTLRAKPWGNKLPLIILTNFDTDNKGINNVNNSNPAYYLLKTNVSLGELIEKSREVTGLSSSGEN